MLSKLATRTAVGSVWSQKGMDLAGSASHGIQFGAGGPGGGAGGTGGRGFGAGLCPGRTCQHKIESSVKVTAGCR